MIKMFHLPEDNHNLSLRLSEVLDDIGVNERMVKKRRRAVLLTETSQSFLLDASLHMFGSQSEGTTTIGLNSDVDQLGSHHSLNVIQDYAEWKPGHDNLLMIQDDTTSPGYCHLQWIRPDMSLPVTNIINKHYARDADGRILLKNTFFDDFYFYGTKNGPARTEEERPGYFAHDTVFGMFCESWPTEARDWSQRSVGKWPTEDMKRYAENSGCFVVPVGSKLGQTEDLEWRISTSKAERCLMFNLNTTQIKCFVLLKMILKTYLQHPLSSYMCKTVLLRCIERTHSNMWQEKNLLKCLTVCLHALYISLLHKSCPHYFIPRNNLMAGQFSPRKKEKLLKSLHHILDGQGAALYGIQIDHLGERLLIKMNPLHQSVQSAQLLSAEEIRLLIEGNDIKNLAQNITERHLFCTREYNCLNSPISVSEKLLQAIMKGLHLHKNGTNIERKTLQLLVPLSCSSLGSVLASVNMTRNYSISMEALNWLLAGLNSDVSSGRLKLASVLYSAGDMLRAESILKETESLYHLDSVQPVCACFEFRKEKIKMENCRVCDNQNEKAIKIVFAYCVSFFPAEMNCIPRELQYELSRSTEEELLHRDEDDDWMDMAVVDSLPFLYFLQYKTYGNLQRYNDQQNALENLALTINLDEDFGHRETALNLLGQCMQQENRLNDAVICYTRSLMFRETNNAARFHLEICRLLADMQNNLH